MILLCKAVLVLCCLTLKMQNLIGKDILSGEAILLKLFCLTFEKGSTLTAKSLLHLGANSFLLEFLPLVSKFFPFRIDPFRVDPFPEGA